MKIIGVDVGGTFTDIIMTDTTIGQQVVHKVPSTPDSQDAAVAKGINEILEQNRVNANEVGLIVHGTTVATNAMLQRKGAHVILLTTAGLEDILEIGRQNRQDIYDLQAKRPEPLVTQGDRLGVRERLDENGSAIIPLLEEEIERIIAASAERQPDAVAISFVFSFRNPNHEQMLLKRIREATGIYAVASSDVLPEFREFERTSTTVLEAYIGPLVLGYLERLDRTLQSLYPNTRLTVMQSNGGTMLCSRANGRAVGLAISGLAGGVIGGWDIASRRGVTRGITLDMGGTSCDISAVVDRVIVRPDNEVSGLPLRTPSVDVKTIGAGGGSIAWTDSAGILHVGPQSAGAEPGPAAYAKGGTDATITDANLLLGRLNPDYFLGGRLPLKKELADTAVSNLAEVLNLTPEETALGIIRISTWNMVQAIREVTVERGWDPRGFILLPFGGAGPTQATDIAEALGIDTILVPPHPGITSAYGLVCADLRVDLMKSILVTREENVTDTLSEALRELTNTARARLREQGADQESIQVERMVDMRYRGQSHEIEVSIPEDFDSIVATTRELFEKAHERFFGYRLSGQTIEWVTVRVVARSTTNEISTKYRIQEEFGTPVGNRRVLLEDDTWATASIYRRDDLGQGQTLKGPSVVEQVDSTVYIAPEWNAEQHGDGVLEMRRDSN